MQISRRVLLACAAAAMIPLSLPAAETADQAKALEEALHQKINQVQGQPAAQPQAPARPAPKAPPPKKEIPKQPQPAAAAPAPVVMSAPQVQGTNANTRALEEALHQKISEPSASAPAAPGQRAPVAAAATPMASPEEAPGFESVTNALTTSSPQEMEKLQEALNQKMTELNAPAKGAQAAPVISTPAAGATMTTSEEAAERERKLEAAVQAARQQQAVAKQKEVKERGHQREMRPVLSETPLVAPPLPISSSKAVELEALLQKYIANQLSPEQYHLERAKILGER